MNDLDAATGIEHGDHRHARPLGSGNPSLAAPWCRRGGARMLSDVRPHGGARRGGGACGGIRMVSDCSVAVPVATVALSVAAAVNQPTKLVLMTSLDGKAFALKFLPAYGAVPAAGLAVTFTMR